MEAFLILLMLLTVIFIVGCYGFLIRNQDDESEIYSAIADQQSSDDNSLGRKTSVENHRSINHDQVLLINQLTTTPNMTVFIADISHHFKDHLDSPPSYQQAMSDK